MEIFESDGRASGLLMLWHCDLNVTSREVHTSYIDSRVDENSDAAWRFTGFYGEPSSERKHLTWDYVRDLHQMNDLPWLIGGDFNEILFGNEKEGAILDPDAVCRHFVMLWMIVTCLKWATLAIFSHGDEVVSEKGWIEEWLTTYFQNYFHSWR